MSRWLGKRTGIVDEDIQLAAPAEKVLGGFADGIERVHVHLDDFQLAFARGGLEDVRLCGSSLFEAPGREVDVCAGAMHGPDRLHANAGRAAGDEDHSAGPCAHCAAVFDDPERGRALVSRAGGVDVEVGVGVECV